MEELSEISLLLDFYGLLITKRQHEVLDLHYNNDYSLGEIAESLKISRQGVFDNIKRGKSTLNEIEGKLKLISRFRQNKVMLGEVYTHLNEIDASNIDSEDVERFKKAKTLIIKLMED